MAKTRPRWNGKYLAGPAGALPVHSATYRASDGLSLRPSFECQVATTYSATPSAQTMPGSGNQIQPHTRVRSSASDDLHCTVIGIMPVILVKLIMVCFGSRRADVRIRQ